MKSHESQRWYHDSVMKKHESPWQDRETTWGLPGKPMKLTKPIHPQGSLLFPPPPPLRHAWLPLILVLLHGQQTLNSQGAYGTTDTPPQRWQEQQQEQEGRRIQVDPLEQALSKGWSSLQ